MRKYKAKQGAYFNTSRVQVYGGELTRIMGENGGTLEPQLVVDNAREKDSPIHECFEWNNKKAGENWRKQQARCLINSIEVVIKFEDREDVVPLAYSIEIKEAGDDVATRRYYDVEVIANDEYLHQELLRKALADFGAYRRRYEQIKELDEIFRVFDRVQNRLELSL